MNEADCLVFVLFHSSVLYGFVINKPKFDPRVCRPMSFSPKELAADHFPLTAPRGTFYGDEPAGLWHSFSLMAGFCTLHSSP